jgi:murein DD-endopeptidase MepM/ murein hydrolase activator NlpD
VPYGTRFGVKGSMWSSGRHTGLDFPAATGTKVVAVDNGTVKSVTSGGPYGKHVMVNHGGGLQSLYAHMSAMVAKAARASSRAPASAPSAPPATSPARTCTSKPA